MDTVLKQYMSNLVSKHDFLIRILMNHPKFGVLLLLNVFDEFEF